jgi:hypothetical protein
MIKPMLLVALDLRSQGCPLFLADDRIRHGTSSRRHVLVGHVVFFAPKSLAPFLCVLGNSPGSLSIARTSR